MCVCIRVKKLRETLVAVQQLDRNMSSLRSWLNHIETELHKPLTYHTCDAQEIQRKLDMQQVHTQIGQVYTLIHTAVTHTQTLHTHTHTLKAGVHTHTHRAVARGSEKPAHQKQTHFGIL